jgi:hypothetical protein
MQRHAGKVRLEAVDCTPSDGYYVFIALIGAVMTTTLIILLSIGIETLI